MRSTRRGKHPRLTARSTSVERRRGGWLHRRMPVRILQRLRQLARDMKEGGGRWTRLGQAGARQATDGCGTCGEGCHGGGGCRGKRCSLNSLCSLGRVWGRTGAEGRVASGFGGRSEGTTVNRRDGLDAGLLGKHEVGG